MLRCGISFLRNGSGRRERNETTFFEKGEWVL